MNEIVRYCPNCSSKIEYKSIRYYKRANEHNRKCLSCTRKAQPRPVLTNEHRLKMSKSQSKRFSKPENNPMFGKKHTEETKRKISKANSGENAPMYGRKNKWGNHTAETKRKMRISRIKEIENKHGTIFPNYNPHACNIIDAYGKEHGFNFQHAENGGEFHIKELGYWVDGYDKEQNVVISYLEKHHRRQTEKDEHRKNEIIDFLGCRFIELKEWEMD